MQRVSSLQSWWYQEVIRNDPILNWVKAWKVKGFDCLGSAPFLQIPWKNVLGLFISFTANFAQKTCRGGWGGGCHLIYMRSFSGDSKQLWMLAMQTESKLNIEPSSRLALFPLCICICKYSSSWLAICATLYWPFLQTLGTVAVGLL